MQSPRPRIWAAATPPHRRPLRRAAHWDGVYCNLDLETLMPLRPAELRDYVGTFREDPDLDVVTAGHPDHAPEDYEAVGVTWLVDSVWPGPDWVGELRAQLGFG